MIAAFFPRPGRAAGDACPAPTSPHTIDTFAFDSELEPSRSDGRSPRTVATRACGAAANPGDESPGDELRRYAQPGGSSPAPPGRVAVDPDGPRSERGSSSIRGRSSSNSRPSAASAQLVVVGRRRPLPTPIHPAKSRGSRFERYLVRRRSVWFDPSRAHFRRSAIRSGRLSLRRAPGRGSGADLFVPVSTLRGSART